MDPKVVGPLTFKQFIIISIGTTLSFMAYLLLGRVNMPAALAIIAAIETVSLVIVFVKVAPKKGE